MSLVQQANNLKQDTNNEGIEDNTGTECNVKIKEEKESSLLTNGTGMCGSVDQDENSGICYKEEIEDIKVFPDNIGAFINVDEDHKTSVIAKSDQLMKVDSDVSKPPEMNIDREQNSDIIKRNDQPLEADSEWGVSNPSDVIIDSNKEFGSRPAILHIRIGDTFACNVCFKQFKQKRDCIRHTRTHTGEKPFLCPHCEKTFGRDCYLRNHIKTHTGEKLFSCSICQQDFARKATLEQHMLTHGGERPYKCTHCGNGFTKKSHLERHLKIHLPREYTYTCYECGQSFHEKRGLNYHYCLDQS
ncbi:unnamed protein product [Meganyctiphanes norvegica]|uniref:C2H2-type domain-containing protein n=1 Tax=Meganyctiphanes norvegica TaxID=48144 RepID=A0AAV2RTQ0_MEGNR